jgi:hypothetical protein
MAGGIIYLDIDDEITSAATRVRASEARRVALVLPFGSRVATSRINFRLLSRDALISEKQLAIIAGDPATRALAASAGLPVFSSIAEYESSFTGPGVEADEAESGTSAGARTASPHGAAAPSPGPAASGVSVPPTTLFPDAAVAGPASRRAAPTAVPRTSSAPPDRTSAARVRPSEASTRQPASAPVRRGPSRTPVIVALVVLALVVLVGAVGAYLFLPSATIVVTPRPEAIAPLELTITADPAASEPNAATLVVPAVRIPLDVTVTDTFPATGKRVAETNATGRVRFSNLDFLRTNTVAGGSVVSTNAGVRFRTNTTVTVPRADLVGLTVFPGRITVGVTAVDPGLAGNVEPNTVVIVPKGEDPQALKVVNPDATTGGTHDEFPKIEQADVDAALKALGTSLDAQLQAQLADRSIVPPGATAFRETATLGTPTPTVADPSSLVDQEVASFDLGLNATGSVIAVDPTPISSIAEQKLRTTVKADHELVADSIRVSVGTATVSGQTVSFPATVSAQQVAVLDAAALRTSVLGRPLADARAILAQFGDVTVTAWPDWVGSIPTVESRVTVSIQGSVPVETPQPSGSAR